jgi:chromosome segregation ATPase
MTKRERAELRSDIRDEIEEIDADLIGYLEDLRRAKEDIAAARDRKGELKAKLAELKTVAV